MSEHPRSHCSPCTLQGTLYSEGGKSSSLLSDLPGFPLPSWDQFVRLDGSLYFYDSQRRLVTKEDMRDMFLRNLVDKKAQELSEAIARTESDLPEDWELCIEYCGEAEDPVLDYHYISHEQAIWFCLGPAGELQVPEAKRMWYWDHVERYCMHLQMIPLLAEVDFLSELAYGAAERALENKETMYQFTETQTRRLLETYRTLKEGLDSGQNVVPALTWLFARVLRLVEENRDRYKYGTFEARPYRPLSIPEPTTWVQILDFFLVFVLFGTHQMYRTRLQSTRIKDVVYLPDFRELLASLLIEWGDTTLLATVFVSANVAFLAVPGLEGIQRTASLCSTLFGLISIVAGVHAVWNHRFTSKADATQEEATRYMEYTMCLGEELGHTVLSCFLCLPIASLLWSVLTFVLAVAAYCVTAASQHEHIVLYLLLGVSASLGFTTTTFFWFIWRGVPFRVKGVIGSLKGFGGAIHNGMRAMFTRTTGSTGSSHVV